MPLISSRMAGVLALEQCAVDDAAHLVQGSSGDHVQIVQQALLDLGEDLGLGGADGIYGGDTAAAVAHFKAVRSILNRMGQIDDVVGKKTIAAIDREIAIADGQFVPMIFALLQPGLAEAQGRVVAETVTGSGGRIAALLIEELALIDGPLPVLEALEELVGDSIRALAFDDPSPLFDTLLTTPELAAMIPVVSGLASSALAEVEAFRPNAGESWGGFSDQVDTI